MGISKVPTPLFKSSYDMTALPHLNGSVGYLFTSRPLLVPSSANVPFREIVDRFRVLRLPLEPTLTLADEAIEYRRGKLITKKDYLVYGRIYVPTARVEGLYSQRHSARLQSIIAAVSDAQMRDGSQLSFQLQHDTGKWCTEYSYTTDDAMFGVRGLWNFGDYHLPSEIARRSAYLASVDRIDSERMEGGVRGRFSIGGEVYYSALEKSGGLSTAFRFTTLPHGTLDNSTQPPVTITTILNPIMGHISTAFVTQTRDELALASRYDFNMYSYESDLVLGLEWWQKSKKQRDAGLAALSSAPPTASKVHPDGIAPLATPLIDDVVPEQYHDDQVAGVVKARLSATTGLALMVEGKVLDRMLVSIGVVADLTSRTSPLKSVGLELKFWA